MPLTGSWLTNIGFGRRTHDKGSHTCIYSKVVMNLIKRKNVTGQTNILYPSENEVLAFKCSFKIFCQAWTNDYPNNIHA